MSDKFTKAFSADISIEEGERAVTAKISTVAVDRDGEVLIPMGCNSRDYEKNPVVLLGHDYYSLPIGKCVAIKRDDKAIYAKTIFAERPADLPAEKEWVPDTILSLFKQGVLRAFSVGFEAIETRPASNKDIENYGAGCQRVFSKWKLMEYSVVPIPANQEAVAMAVSKGYISAENSKKLFGDPVQRMVDEKMEEILQERRKRVFFVLPAPPAPKKDMSRTISAVIAKKCGRVYVV